MRRPVIAGNWKMHKTIPEALEFVRQFKPLVVSVTRCEIIIAPPFTALKAVSDRLEGTNVQVASQDVAPEPGSGAFTGEVSAIMIRDAGARWAIIGHSERRRYYCETNDSVNAKIRAALGADLNAIVCVGERLEDRDQGRAQLVVDTQITEGMRNLTGSEASRIIVAYEPVWAIGTGRIATPEIAQEMCWFIRSRLKGIFGEGLSENARILYGGSANPDNVEGLLSQPDVDGGLVGGGSLEPEIFAKVVHIKESSRSF
ncbi:MAG TPA: triose-phosphate isomerase [Blastocatellia bacterium]|nr:triose-phosphate isomerase [Blastocatellia bacterium]